MRPRVVVSRSAATDASLRATTRADRAPHKQQKKLTGTFTDARYSRAMLRTADTYPPDITLREGRDRYLAENGFTVATYTETWARVPLWRGLHVWIPSPEARRRALRMHDLHHVLTGYGTDLTGEAEISAWELRRGLDGLGVYVGGIISLALVQGAVRRPGRTYRAYAASTSSPSLFNGHHDYDALLSRTVGDVRRELGIPEAGLVETRALHEDAPK